MIDLRAVHNGVLNGLAERQVRQMLAGKLRPLPYHQVVGRIVAIPACRRMGNRCSFLHLLEKRAVTAFMAGNGCSHGCEPIASPVVLTDMLRPSSSATNTCRPGPENSVFLSKVMRPSSVVVERMQPLTDSNRTIQKSSAETAVMLIVWLHAKRSAGRHHCGDIPSGSRRSCRKRQPAGPRAGGLALQPGGFRVSPGSRALPGVQGHRIQKSDSRRPQAAIR